MFKHLVLGLLAATSFTFAFAQGDADIPPKFSGNIKADEYQRLRSEHFNLIRGLPADPGFREAATSQMRAQKSAARSALSATGAAVAPPQWTALGPTPIPTGQVTGALPVSGRVTSFVMDPGNSNKLYLGTAQGGVYRSLDAGNSWTQIFDSATTSAIGALALLLCACASQSPAPRTSAAEDNRAALACTLPTQCVNSLGGGSPEPPRKSTTSNDDPFQANP